MPELEVQGARYATILHIEKVTIAGKTNYRIVFRFVNDNTQPARETLVRPEQASRFLRIGMLARVHFCFSRVLRIEKVG